MLKSKWNFLRLAAACGIGLLALRARATGLPEQIRDSLERSCEAALPLTVHWTLERTSALANGELLRLLEQPNAERLLVVTECRLELQGAKFHSWEQYKGGRKWELSELAFDSECFYQSHGTSMHVVNDAMLRSGPAQPVFVPSYFAAAGFVVPNTYRTFGQRPKSQLLQFLEDGGVVERLADEAVEGAPCMRVDVAHGRRSFRFWLDPALNYAVRQVEEWNGQKRIKVTRCQHFQKMRAPLHLPRVCRTDYFVYLKHSLPDSTRPIIAEVCTVSALNQSTLPDARFVLVPEVGMHVSDSRLPEAREFERGFAHYVMPARPEDLQKAIDEASTELREALASQKRASAGLRWMVVAVAAGIVAIISAIGYMAMRWRVAEG